MARCARRGPCVATVAVEVEIARARGTDVGIVFCAEGTGRSNAAIGAATRVDCIRRQRGGLLLIT